MELISNILLISAAIGATIYCVVLSRRLRRFTDLEKGVGGAIAALSTQVDDMTKTLREAQSSAAQSACSLEKLTGKAQGAAQRLELLVASLHDLPEPPRSNETHEPEPAKSASPQQAKPMQTAAPETAQEPLFLSKRHPQPEAAQ